MKELLLPAHGTLLLICAHPDDETAVPALIRKAVNEGVHVHALFATSGEASKSKATGPEREAESTAALTMLGVPKKNIRFLRLPDGEVVFAMTALRDAIRQTIDRVRPQTLLSLAYEGGHLDHDSVNAATHFARRGTPTVHMEFPSYHLDLWRMRALAFPRIGPPGGRIRTLSVEDHEKLYRAMKDCFPSQHATLDRIEKDVDVKAIYARGECWRVVPRDRDFSQPPGTRPLLYEVVAWPKRRTFGLFKKEVHRLSHGR